MISLILQQRLESLHASLAADPANSLAIHKQWYAEAAADLGPEESHFLATFDQIVAVLATNVATTRPQVVLLIHGIRTHAEWQGRVTRLLTTSTCKVLPIKYQYVNVFQFLVPLVRWFPQNYILTQIREARANNPDAELIIVAHSFGSYCVAQMLRGASDVRCARMLLCGSVIRERFKWRLLPNCPEIVNECGCRDIWPVLAMGMSIGFGASGTHGFGQAGNVRDRFHDLKHSDYFLDRFVTKFWMPWIHHGTFVDSDYELVRAPSPLLVRLLTIVQPRYVCIAALILWLALAGLQKWQLAQLRGLGARLEFAAGQLETVRIDGNATDTRRILRILWWLPTLRRLYVATRLQEPDVAAIGKLSQVERLYLSDSNIDDPWLEHLSSLSGLETLALANTQISGEGLTYLSRLPRLRVLNLSRTHVTDRWLAPLSQCLSLESLFLSDTPLTKDCLAIVAKIPNLRKLFVNRKDGPGPTLTDEAVISFLSRQSLEVFDVRNSGVTPSRMHAIRSPPPEFRID